MYRKSPVRIHADAAFSGGPQRFQYVFKITAYPVGCVDYNMQSFQWAIIIIGIHLLTNKISQVFRICACQIRVLCPVIFRLIIHSGYERRTLQNRLDITAFQAAVSGKEFKAVPVGRQMTRCDHNGSVILKPFQYRRHKHGGCRRQPTVIYTAPSSSQPVNDPSF